MQWMGDCEVPVISAIRRFLVAIFGILGMRGIADA